MVFFPNLGGIMEIGAISQCRHEFDFERSERSRQESGFEKAIFSPRGQAIKFSGRADFSAVRTLVDQRVSRVFMDRSAGGVMLMKNRGGGASGAVELRVEWGGREGPKVDVGVQGNVRDSHGNYAKAEVSTNNDNGRPSTSIQVGNDKNDSSSSKVSR